VTDGSYSDYHIEAVFSTKALAEEYVRKNDGGTIETYILDERKEIWYGLLVYMDKEGNSSYGDVLINPYLYETEFGFQGFDYEGNLMWCVKSATATEEDKKRAVKVANEKRMQILALGLWGDKKAIAERVR